jgi:hypothetical protein
VVQSSIDGGGTKLPAQPADAAQQQQQQQEQQQPLPDPPGAPVTEAAPRPKKTPTPAAKVEAVDGGESLGQGFQCKEKDMGPRTEQRSGNYWVFYNYIQVPI